MISNKYLLISAVVIALATPTTLALSADDLLGVPGPVRFGGDEFVLTWSAQPSDGYFKQEYVPDGQSVEAYTSMFLLEAVIGTLSPMEAAAAQVKTLEARKGTDPVVNYSILQDEKTGAALLDFVISDLKADPVIVEWNAYRYEALEAGQGVALYAISHRGYGEDGAKQFMQELGQLRSAALAELGAADLPSVVLE